MVPSQRLLLLTVGGLAVATLPMLVRPELWLVVFGMWAALAIAALVDVLVLYRARPKLSATPPKMVGVGDPFGLPIAVQLGGALRLPGTVRAEVEEPLAAVSDAKLVATPGHSAHEVELIAPHRGAGRLEALWLRLEGPLGLFARIDRHRLDGPAVSVVPNVRRVRELTLAHFGSQPLRGGLKLERRAGDGGEFDAMVGYVQGMDLRAVDWKSSARHQALRVRRYRLERNQRMVVCVDTGRLMADPIDGLERVDHAVHAAMLLSRTALHAGDLVGLHAYGAEPVAYVPPAGGMRHAAKISEACAGLRSRAEETNHVLGMHTLLKKLRRRSLVVVFSEFTDSTTAELMVEHLGHLARRHLVIFVALDDPAVEAPLRDEPRGPEDLAAAVVAGALRADRRRIQRRLERMGVDVVSGPPGPASLRLLQRYLHVKSRGLIG